MKNWERVIFKINVRLLNVFLLIVFLKLYLSFRDNAGALRGLFRGCYMAFFVQLVWLINHDILAIFEKIRKHREKKNIDKKENDNGN